MATTMHFKSLYLFLFLAFLYHLVFSAPLNKRTPALVAGEAEGVAKLGSEAGALSKGLQAVGNGFKKVGSGTVLAAKSTGGAIAKGAKSTGGAIAKGAKTVGGAIATGATKTGAAVGSAAKAAGQAVKAGGKKALMWTGIGAIGAGAGNVVYHAGEHAAKNSQIRESILSREFVAAVTSSYAAAKATYSYA